MKIPFEKIYDSDLIHPVEEIAEKEFQQNPLYDWFAQEIAALKSNTNERADTLIQLYPVTRLTAPRLNSLYETVLKNLNCEEKYPLFLKWEYEIKFQVSGSDANGHIIILSSTSEEELYDEELKALLGQAVGRIKAGHAKNLQMLEFLKSGINSLPFVGAVAAQKFWSCFAKWLIASNFTEDRFALRACGSEKAIASLLLKQNGLAEFDIEKILNQPVAKSENLGIYFVWLNKSISTFGAVERIQELRRWIRSAKFFEQYPGFYYRLRIEAEDFDNSLAMNLHRKVEFDDEDAIVNLAQFYLKGSENLPPSFFMVTELNKAASFLGNAQALYFFGLCLEKSEKIPNENILNRIYEAALSRNYEPARKKIKSLSEIPKNNFVEKICSNFYDTYKDHTVCKTKISAEQIEKYRNAFWMNRNEKIFALEVYYENEDGFFGVAITESGIFGRVSEKFLPFFISWIQLKNGEILRRNKVLMCDKIIIANAENKLQGTVGELIVRMAQHLKS